MSRHAGARRRSLVTGLQTCPGDRHFRAHHIRSIPRASGASRKDRRRQLHPALAARRAITASAASWITDADRRAVGRRHLPCNAWPRRRSSKLGQLRDRDFVEATNPGASIAYPRAAALVLCEDTDTVTIGVVASRRPAPKTRAIILSLESRRSLDTTARCAGQMRCAAQRAAGRNICNPDQAGHDRHAGQGAGREDLASKGNPPLERRGTSWDEDEALYVEGSAAEGQENRFLSCAGSPAAAKLAHFTGRVKAGSDAPIVFLVHRPFVRRPCTSKAASFESRSRWIQDCRAADTKGWRLWPSIASRTPAPLWL